MGGDEVGLKKGEGASIFDVSCLSFCFLAISPDIVNARRAGWRDCLKIQQKLGER